MFDVVGGFRVVQMHSGETEGIEKTIGGHGTRLRLEGLQDGDTSWIIKKKKKKKGEGGGKERKKKKERKNL